MCIQPCPSPSVVGLFWRLLHGCESAGVGPYAIYERLQLASSCPSEGQLWVGLRRWRGPNSITNTYVAYWGNSRFRLLVSQAIQANPGFQ